MSKRVVGHDNYRVVIEPKRLGDFGSVRVSDGFFYKTDAARQKAYLERCEEITQEVKRHVDNVGWVGVEYDTITECEFCGATWTEPGDKYNGGCCDRDELGKEI